MTVPWPPEGFPAGQMSGAPFRDEIPRKAGGGRAAMAAEPQVTCPEDWTPEQVEEFRKAWDEYWATARKHEVRWLPAGATVTERPQQVVLQLQWAEDGRERQELFGPWAQGDPETEDGPVTHMMAAHRFIGEWRRVTGLDLADGGATVILVLDPEEWLREREAGQSI